MNQNKHDIATNGRGPHQLPTEGIVDDNPYLRRRMVDQAGPGDTQIKQRGVLEGKPSDEDAPPRDAAPKSNRRKKVAFGVFLLAVMVVAGALVYFKLGSTGSTTKIDYRVEALRTAKPGIAQVEGTDETRDQQTEAAIAQAKESLRAGQSQSKESTADTKAPTVTAPPKGQIDDLPRLSIPDYGYNPRTPPEGVNSEQPGQGREPATQNARRRTLGQPHHGESSIYVSASGNVKATATTNTSIAANTIPAMPAGAKFERAKENAIALPPFGEMLPVKLLSGLYTIRSGSLARLELQMDITGDGWSLKRGTVLVAQTQGSNLDRAYLRVLGFIDPATNRFVKVEGQVLGNDGSPGLQGKRRRVNSRWVGALNRAINVGQALSTAALARGGATVIVGGTSGLGGDVGLNLSTLSNQEFVEVQAGATGMVEVIDLPDGVEGKDADPAQNLAGGGQDPLSDDELAELLTNGTPEKIRAALPRMTPEMRKVAEMAVGKP
jgi:hypothetical protein